MGAALVAACTDATGTPRPSPSLIELDFTPQPTATVSATGSTSPSAPPSPAWPEGWDVAFCAMLTDAVIAQELVVDIERAIDEEAMRDARGLARELSVTAAAASGAIGAIPAWDDDDELLGQIEALMALNVPMGEEYETYLRDDARGALRRARNLRRDNGQAVPEINTGLEALAGAGLSCVDAPMVLESP
jgi:hypothetical protein